MTEATQTTARLCLRPIRLDDEAGVAASCAILRDPQTWTHLPAARPTSEKAIIDHLSAHADSWQNFGLGWWFVALPAKQRAVRAGSAPEGEGVIGVAGCARIPADIPAWNLGFRFSPLAWGRGYAAEAARAGIEAAAQVDSRMPVVARALEGNTASWRLLERLGLSMVWQGVLGSQDPVTQGLSRRIYADRPLTGDLVNQLVSLG